MPISCSTQKAIGEAEGHSITFELSSTFYSLYLIFKFHMPDAFRKVIKLEMEDKVVSNIR